MNLSKIVNKIRQHRYTASQTIVLGFLVVILVGTFLLMTPLASVSGKFTDPLTALFTATSATCVTGLSVVTTAEYWSMFGQIVILCMIQIGGLGFMSMAILASLIIKHAITPKEHTLVSQSLGTGASDGAATRFMAMIVGGTFSLELVGAALLSIRMIPKYGVGTGIYYSLFHSISAFCNAGFDIIGTDSMAGFYSDPLVLLTLTALIIVGGIGFAVWADVIALIGARKHGDISGTIRSVIGRRDRLSVYTKFVLIVTLILLVWGTLSTLILEWDGVLAQMTVPDKILNAFFYSVSMRTAGFTTFDNSSLHDFTKLISCFFMLIGGASGSTAGGLKVSTVAILFYAAWKIALGNNEIVLFRRKISNSVILRAMTLVIIGLCFVGVSTSFIGAISGVPVIDCLYEASSAYATVGLSAAGTASFGIASRMVLILLMFMGRVGILTITYSLVVKSVRKHALIKYPDISFMIG